MRTKTSARPSRSTSSTPAHLGRHVRGQRRRTDAPAAGQQHLERVAHAHLVGLAVAVDVPGRGGDRDRAGGRGRWRSGRATAAGARASGWRTGPRLGDATGGAHRGGLRRRRPVVGAGGQDEQQGEQGVRAHDEQPATRGSRPAGGAPPRGPTRRRRRRPCSTAAPRASLPSAPSTVTALASLSKPVGWPVSPTSLTTSRSQPLRASLARAWSSTEPSASPVSAAKPTSTCPGRRAATSSARTSGFCTSSTVSASRLLALGGEALDRPVVGDGGGHDDRVGALALGQHRVAQLERARHPAHRDARGVGQRRAATTSTTSAPRAAAARASA